MVQSALVEVLSALSEKEWSLLLERPSLKVKDRAFRLVLYIHKSMPLKPAGENKIHPLEKQKAYAALYTKQKFDDQRLREDMSQLLGEVKDFLAEGELVSNGHFTDYLLLSALRKKKTIKAWQRALNGIEKQNDNGRLRDEWYYLQQALVAQEREQLTALQPARQANTGIQQEMEGLDRYYIISKLKLYCEQLNRMHILNVEYRPLMMDEIMDTIRKYETLRKLPQVNIYFHIILMLLHPEEEHHFNALVELLARNVKEFSHEEGRNLYRYAQNYCIRKINKGMEAYYTELLNIFRQLLSSGLILNDGEIDHTDYKNIVTTGLRLKEYKWTLDFIETYRALLPKALQDGAYLYNKANYHYEAGELKQASDLLLNVQFSDVFYNLSARHLLLKIFYDEEEFDALTYQVESFRVFLGRNKTISKANKESNTNFLKVMRRLAGARQMQGYLKSEVLQKRTAGIMSVINKYDPLANKNWLLEKVREMK